MRNPFSVSELPLHEFLDASPLYLGAIGPEGQAAVATSAVDMGFTIQVVSFNATTPTGPSISIDPIPFPSSAPNIVLVLADDMGVDLVGAYGETSNPPCAPHIDQLAAEGLLFRNAWTNPLCVPSRAQLLTGRYGFRTGLGTTGQGSNLSLSEVTLPEMLVGYTSAALGKWGVGSSGGSGHPNDSGFCASNPSTTIDQVKAMAEAMDTELGRPLETIEAVDPEAIIVFMGDNGTIGMATEAPFDPTHAKVTVYEGGINVPLLVKGPGVVRGECEGLVTSADLAATFSELAGFATSAEDSVSMVPYFSNPNLSLRSTVFSEKFSPNNGTLPFTDHDRAIRNHRYKLIRRTNEPDELYDLSNDPFEATDLYPNLVPGNSAYFHYQFLVQALVDLGVD